MRFRPPHWLPWLGPLLAAGAGALAGEYWLGGGVWMVLIADLVCGLAPILDHRLWRRLHHKA